MSFGGSSFKVRSLVVSKVIFCSCETSSNFFLKLFWPFPACPFSSSSQNFTALLHPPRFFLFSLNPSTFPSLFSGVLLDHRSPLFHFAVLIFSEYFLLFHLSILGAFPSQRSARWSSSLDVWKSIHIITVICDRILFDPLPIAHTHMHMNTQINKYIVR